MYETAAVIVAAGDSTRMKLGCNKNYIEHEGRLLLSYTLAAFGQCPEVDRIVLVIKDSERESAERAVAQAGIGRDVMFVPGADTRQGSVFSGLTAAQGCTYAAIHDGARCLISPADISRVLKMTCETGAATLVSRVNDTCMWLTEDRTQTECYLDRARMAAVQTPQCFLYDRIMRAHIRAREDGFTGTDDTGIYRRYEGKVELVYSENINWKITEPGDLELAEAILRFREERG
ncbi:MAG: 2-C-methyl-D-erythritol 4-phosphate cytidylyltransferase [Eubacteriaceae bacterium]|nr:2-C-methyl-D-erythritol 4-phosphate cytidylyltransferase [Eubacteriaceae bacterium]